MSKKLIPIIALLMALAIKGTLAFALLKYVLYVFDFKVSAYNQPLIVWILLYIPYYAGLESIISHVYKKIKNQNNE